MIFSGGLCELRCLLSVEYLPVIPYLIWNTSPIIQWKEVHCTSASSFAPCRNWVRFIQMLFSECLLHHKHGAYNELAAHPSWHLRSSKDSNHIQKGSYKHTVHFKYIQFLFVNYISIKVRVQKSIYQNAKQKFSLCFENLLSQLCHPLMALLCANTLPFISLKFCIF